MKKLLAPALFVFLFGILSTCSDQTNCCTNIFLNVQVELQNADGEDMLNPAIPGNIKVQDVEVYYEIGGKLETFVSLNKGAILDNPQGFDVQSDGTNYSLHVLSNPTAGSNVITLIQIKDHPEIKLVTKVEDDHGLRITELQYNNQLVWSNSMSSQQYPIVRVKFD